jgi:hypothetical protein
MVVMRDPGLRSAGLIVRGDSSDDQIALGLRLICFKKTFLIHDPFGVSRSTCVFLALYVSSVAA